MHMQDPVSHFVIIDSNALIHRSYHALPDLSTRDGTPVNAVYGYVSVLLNVLRTINPDYIGAAFDLEGPTFRDEMYEEYKAQRERGDQALYDQIPLTKQVLESFGIPILTAEGYEADDVIGTVTSRLNEEHPDLEVLVVTGDMDTMQLVGERTKIFSLRKGVKDTVIYDVQGVRDKYDLEPNQIADFKGLKGDPSDNIPGVSGVGDKTATQLLKAFEHIENLYETLEGSESYEELSNADQAVVSAKLYKKLRSQEEQARFSKELATINCEVPLDLALEEYHVHNFDRETIANTFRKFEFESLISRLDEALGAQATPEEESKPPEPLEDLPYDTKLSPENECVLYQAEDTLVAVSDTGEATRISDVHTLYQIAADERITKIGHDLKPLLKGFWDQGIDTHGEWFDLRIAAYVLNAGEREYPLSELISVYESAHEGVMWRDMFALAHKLREEVRDKELETVLSEIELPLMHVLAHMEQRGIYINQETLYDLQTEVSHRLEALTDEIYTLAEQEFNIDSPQQLSRVLFEDLGLPKKGLKKTSSGFVSTSASTLEKLSKDYEIVTKILEYRELAKLYGTYILPLVDYADENSVIHTSFLQTVTATGRLSSANPNLQNIPHYSETGQKIRQAFQPRNGYVFAALDYSQFELRLAAHLSGDEQMVDIFRSGTDFHAATAARMYGVAEEKVTKEMRTNAKTINFGILYGMGPQALSGNLNVSRKEAEEYLASYRETFSTLITYLDSLKEKARKQGYAETEYGRVRDLSGYNEKNPRQQAAMERVAVNMPIQGLQADIIKLAMIRIDEQFAADENVHMLLQVHDELVFEIAEEEVQGYIEPLRDLMSSVYKASVPLPVEADVAYHWK